MCVACGVSDGVLWGKLGKTLGSARRKLLVEFLVERREAIGLPQAELAEDLGEYQSLVARRESGQRRVDVIEFLELARMLKFDPVAALKKFEKFR